jgi:hypothetical protein
MLLTKEDILELAGEPALDDVRDLNLRGQKLDTFESFSLLLPNLLALSLSHNLLSSLKGFCHLIQLQSLNLNFNCLTTLEGIQPCVSLQHLYAANNKISDLTPLACLTSLRTVSMYRNSITSLESTLAVLTDFPSLSDLDLGGNPCSQVPDYKTRIVLELPTLTLLDGDVLTELDREMAAESLVWVPADTQEGDAATAPLPTEEAGMGATELMMYNAGSIDSLTSGNAYHQEVSALAGGGTADVLTVHHSERVISREDLLPPSGSDREEALPHPSDFSAQAQARKHSPQCTSPMQPSPSKTASASPDRPVTASTRFYCPCKAQRPGTASMQYRPGASERPSTSCARVSSNDFLNDHPVSALCMVAVMGSLVY